MLVVLGIATIVVLLIGVNALYVAGEFATVGARRPRILQMAEEGNTLARSLAQVIESPRQLDTFIAASQIGITISSIVLGIYGQRQIAPRITPLISALPLGDIAPFVSEAAAAGTAAVVVLFSLTALQMIFGELVPKSLALRYPESTALATLLPLKVSAEYIFRPLIFLLNGSGAVIMRMLGLRQAPGHTHIHSPEEIVILVKESHRGGLLDADERRMLRNVFRVSEATAAEVAIPRTRLVAADIDEPLEEVLRRAAGSAYSRIPIFEKDIDQIIGYVHLRELFSLYLQEPGGDIRNILRPLPFVPETLHAMQVWQRLNEEDSYLAIVFDEYGGTSGMITREDLIEELFGEVQDEFDQEPSFFRPEGKGRLVVRGDMPLSVLSDLLDVDLPHEHTFTVSGLIQEELGRIPQVGDSVTVKNIRFDVEAVARTRVTQACISLPANLQMEAIEEVDE